MANISITKMSSKGQVVIPLDLRGDFKEGDKLVVLKNDKQIILKKAEDFDENIMEDLEFVKKTEEVLKAHDKGEFTSYSEKEFLDKLDKW